MPVRKHTIFHTYILEKNIIYSIIYPEADKQSPMFERQGLKIHNYKPDTRRTRLQLRRL